jgi:hypothetical protein
VLLDRKSNALSSANRPGHITTLPPDHKHQVWEKGENLTRRVPADEVEALALAIDGRKQFEKLAEEFIDTTVAMTRAESSPESKKKRDEIQAAVEKETAGIIEQFLKQCHEDVGPREERAGERRVFRPTRKPSNAQRSLAKYWSGR